MKRNIKQRLGAVLCILLALALSGCTMQQTSTAPAPTLAPAVPAHACPHDDNALSYTAKAQLYLPSPDSQQLKPQTIDFAMSHARPNAHEAVSALLSYPANAEVRSLGGDTKLTLFGRTPVEVCGGVCTINLASSALALSPREFYTLCLSIASTVGRLDKLNYVNVLIADQAVALDLAGYLPTGSVTAHPGEDLVTLWNAAEVRKTQIGQDPGRVPVTTAATLYFPLADGSGFVPEVRSLTFEGQRPAMLADTLLEALSAGPLDKEGIANMPDLSDLMISTADCSDLPDGSRMITLKFQGNFLEQLSMMGVDPASLMGAITYTLTTFIPSVSAVRMMSDNALISSLYSPAMGTMLFADGLHRRSQYAGLLMEQVSIYMARNNQLARVQRTVPCADAANLRALMSVLCGGPTTAEDRAGYRPVMPAGIDESDLIGIAIEEDTLVLNLHERFGQAIERQTVDEQLLCYALVNTLCEAKGLRRACFYVASEARETLGGELYWGGEFMVNRSLIGQ